MKKCEASLAIQVLPGVSGGYHVPQDEVVRIVDQVIAYLKSTGLSTYVGPFETTVEGGFDEIWDAAKECHRICIREGAPSVASYMKLFYNPEAGVLGIDQKVTKHHQ